MLVSQKGYASFPHSAMVFTLKALTCKGFADMAQALQSHSNQTINIFHFSNGVLLWTYLAITSIYAHTYKNKKVTH